eukprot:30616-Amphidinium_carterae.1
MRKFQKGTYRLSLSQLSCLMFLYTELHIDRSNGRACLEQWYFVLMCQLLQQPVHDAPHTCVPHTTTQTQKQLKW